MECSRKGREGRQGFVRETDGKEIEGRRVKTGISSRD